MQFTFPVLWTTRDLLITAQNELARRAFSLSLHTKLKEIDLPALQKTLDRQGYADLLWTAESSFLCVTFLVLQDPKTQTLAFLAPAPLQHEPFRSLLLAKVTEMESFCRTAQEHLFPENTSARKDATAGARHRFAKRLSAWQKIQWEEDTLAFVHAESFFRFCFLPALQGAGFAFRQGQIRLQEQDPPLCFSFRQFTPLLLQSVLWASSWEGGFSVDICTDLQTKSLSVTFQGRPRENQGLLELETALWDWFAPQDCAWDYRTDGSQCTLALTIPQTEKIPAFLASPQKRSDIPGIRNTMERILCFAQAKGSGTCPKASSTI